MAFTNASKRAVIELLSDEEVDAELSAPAKKRAKVLKKQGNVTITAVVALFYKRQIQDSEPQTINNQERSSRCVHCQKVFVAWRNPNKKQNKKNPTFNKDFIVDHLKSCKHVDGKAAYKKHTDFVKAGSNDITILFPTNDNNEHFYQSNCGLCGELVCVAVKKPNDHDEKKLWSAHLSEHCTLIPVARLNFFNHEIEQRLDFRFTDAKIYAHADSTNVERPCFYAFRSKSVLVYSKESFLGSFTYWGHTAMTGDSFLTRISMHSSKNKFNISTTDSIPLAYASKEDVRKTEAIAYWLFKGREAFRNTQPIIDPLTEMTAVEFNLIVSSLSTLLHRFYVSYSSKITIEQQKAQSDQAKLTIFSKAREEYGKMLNEDEKHLFESSDKVLLAPELMNAIGSNPELLRKFQAVLSEVQDEINDMK